jgi:uncharacterized protein (TIGR01244 family)
VSRSFRRLLLVLVWCIAGCGVTEVLDHAEDGTPILIRTPQPDADDLRDLDAEYGVRTVLNLRGESDAGWFAEEREGVDAIQARWVHLPVSGSRGPTPDQIEAFFDLVEDASAWPVLAHCQGGIHRTGVMSALYRIQYQGWSSQRAIEEMEDNWFNWTTRDRDAIKDLLRAYQPDPQRSIDRAARGSPAQPE